MVDMGVIAAADTNRVKIDFNNKMTNKWRNDLAARFHAAGHPLASNEINSISAAIKRRAGKYRVEVEDGFLTDAGGQGRFYNVLAAEKKAGRPSCFCSDPGDFGDFDTATEAAEFFNTNYIANNANKIHPAMIRVLEEVLAKEVGARAR